ncbi:ATP-binding protein [Lysobacter tyrosinilyticus]
MSDKELLAPRSQLAARIFAGKGETAALIRERDWTQTPLGPVESWPQSLRTAVSICLGSRHPIVLWWGPERWMFYNDAYRPMLGEKKHPQYLGASGQECWAEVWDVIGPMMEQVIATGEPTWSEDLFLLMLRDGYLEETFFTFSYSPIRDDSGIPCGIFNACAETTARVLSERRLQALRAMNAQGHSVEEAAQHCAAVWADNARDIPFGLIYLLDRSGEQLQLFGQAGLVPGTAASPREVPLAAPSSWAAWPLAEVLASGRPKEVAGLAHRFDCLPTAPWGDAAHEAWVAPIPRPGSATPAGVVVLGISPRRAFDAAYRNFFELVSNQLAAAVAHARAYAEQRERAEQFAELDRSKTTFFNNVSHEFRTPLTLILGPIEDALSTPNPVLQGSALSAVHRSARRLLRLVNSLLDFARIEAGRMQSAFVPTDLALLTAGLAGSYQSLMTSAGLILVVDCPPLREPVYVDRAQWEKIVLNLISNAFKFTFQGRIAVRLRAHDRHVTLTVSDTGTGIPADALSRIFERFHRVEGAKGRSFEGTGIGLAMVRELVRQHGGEIEVHSKVGEGSSFEVTIPLGTAHLPLEQIVTDAGPLAASDSGVDTLEAAQWLHEPVPVEAVPADDAAHERARLLLADDNADMREYLVRLLSPRYDVEAVVDGEEALARALQQPPDLVLSDVMMPRMDGVTLLRRLREEPATATIPVVLLSARAGEEAIVAGLETGADDYLVKPFSARELISRVRSNVELARMRRLAAEAAQELAETRAALLQDLEARNQELEAFSYSVSHDLRAPLRTIDGFSKMLLEDYASDLPEDAQHYLRRMDEGVRRMSELVTDLLRMARASRGELTLVPIDLSMLAQQVVLALRHREPGREVRVAIAEHLTVQGDGGLLQIALENLIGNAWKFTTRQAAPLIEIGRERQGDEDVFFVRDNGAGFDMAQAGKLFAPFQRLHADADYQGTGLGLVTIQRIVARHGGRIWVSAAVGEGATFYFTLAPGFSTPRPACGERDSVA